MSKTIFRFNKSRRTVTTDESNYLTGPTAKAECDSEPTPSRIGVGERAHIKRMLAHAKRYQKKLGKPPAELTPQQLADTLAELKKKYPGYFP